MEDLLIATLDRGADERVGLWGSIGVGCGVGGGTRQLDNCPMHDKTCHLLLRLPFFTFLDSSCRRTPTDADDNDGGVGGVENDV